MIQRAFENWPERHNRQFTSKEELRIWLQLEAGHKEIGAQIPLVGMHRERALMLVEGAIRGSRSMATPELQGDTMVIYVPKSVALARMKHEDFNRLSNAVQELIEQHTGIVEENRHVATSRK